MACQAVCKSLHACTQLSELTARHGHTCVPTSAKGLKHQRRQVAAAIQEPARGNAKSSFTTAKAMLVADMRKKGKTYSPPAYVSASQDGNPRSGVAAPYQKPRYGDSCAPLLSLALLYTHYAELRCARQHTPEVQQHAHQTPVQPLPSLLHKCSHRLFARLLQGSQWPLQSA